MSPTFHLPGKSVFITGGTGSWGQEFTRQLVQLGAKRIGIYSRGEYHQVEMRRAFQQHPGITYVLGDVRDQAHLLSATRGYDVIIHLAALKHVPVVEENPREAVKTNILGTQNVIDAAVANGIQRVLYVSSDKAVDPLNFYGITKLASERMMRIANEESADSRFVIYRAGNVMGSAGSVIPIFQETLSKHNSIKLTDPAMTRFFLSKRDVVHRACQALECGMGGEIFVPKMKSTTLKLLSEVMIKHLGQEGVQVERINIRPGEKIHELLISRNEIPRTRELEFAWIILPFFPSPDLIGHYADSSTVGFTEYSSETAERFSFDELESLLKMESFLTPMPNGRDKPLYFKKDEFDFH